MPTATLMNQKVREIHFNNDLERKHGTNRQLGSSFSFQVNYSPDGERCVAKLYHSLKDKEDENGIKSRELVTAERPLDFVALESFFVERGKKFGAESAWVYKVAAFNRLLCMRTAQSIGADVKTVAEKFATPTQARDIDLGIGGHALTVAGLGQDQAAVIDHL